ncbi:MAG: hypothetical protein EAY75_15670 [Bacteroidetes bacterium]|nr:MAG: hypothetical protein EAY75_15670 [Bacteroidota bacterium]
MKLYRLKNKDMNWADYGDILLTGMTSHLDRQKELLQYERTGPFQPSIIISGLDDLLVTDSVKKGIEASELKGFQFKPVIKRHISFVDWTNWNLQSEDPEFYPDNGEPENYILSLPHSQELSDQMENVWEVVAEENGIFINSQTYKQGDKDIDIMRTENSGWFLVTENAKNWIEENCDKWTEFWDLDDLPY